MGLRELVETARLLGVRDYSDVGKVARVVAAKAIARASAVCILLVCLLAAVEIPSA